MPEQTHIEKEVLDPDTIYFPSRIIVNRTALLQILDEWDERIANEIKDWRKFKHLIDTGTTPSGRDAAIKTKI